SKSSTVNGPPVRPAGVATWVIVAPHGMVTARTKVLTRTNRRAFMPAPDGDRGSAPTKYLKLLLTMADSPSLCGRFLKSDGDHLSREKTEAARIRQRAGEHRGT